MRTTTTTHVERDRFGKTTSIETTTRNDDGSSDGMSVSEKIFGPAKRTIVSRTRTDKDGNSSTTEE